jgi:hypothetical protein
MPTLQLIRIIILYARRVLPDIFGAQEHCLLKIHFLLGLSWEELRPVICPLRELLGDDSARLRALLMFNSDTSLESNSVFYCWTLQRVVCASCKAGVATGDVSLPDLSIFNLTF